MRIVKNFDLKRIDEFIKNHSEGNFFQTSLFFRINNKPKNYSSGNVIVEDKNNNIIGVLIYVIQNFINKTTIIKAKRSLIIGGPLVINNDKEILKFILKFYNDNVGKKVLFTEIRNLYDSGNLKECFINNGFNFSEHLNLIKKIDSDLNGTFKSLSESKQLQIKKTLAKGTKIIEPESLFQVEEFYLILKKLYKEKVKRPLPDWTFFKNYFVLSRNNPSLKYFLIEYSGKIIGGVMAPVFYKKHIYEWYICGLDKKDKDVHPSILATWAVIEYAVKNKIKYFNLMGAGKPDKEYGVRDFKKRFNAKINNHGRFYKIHKPLQYFMARISFVFWRLL